MRYLNKLAIFLCILALLALATAAFSANAAIDLARDRVAKYWGGMTLAQVEAAIEAMAVLSDERAGAARKEYDAVSLRSKEVVTQADVDRHDEVWGRILSEARATPVPSDEKKAQAHKAHLASMEKAAATIPWRRWQVQMRAREYNDTITSGGPYQAYAKAHDLKPLFVIKAKPQ